MLFSNLLPPINENYGPANFGLIYSDLARHPPIKLGRDCHGRSQEKKTTTTNSAYRQSILQDPSGWQVSKLRGFKPSNLKENPEYNDLQSGLISSPAKSKTTSSSSVSTGHLEVDGVYRF